MNEVNADGTVYMMSNANTMLRGVERVDFILQYRGNNIPSGSCVTKLPSPGQSSFTTTNPRRRSITTSTTTPTTTTMQSSGNGMYQVPVVKIVDPWRHYDGSWVYPAKCSFQVNSSCPSGTFLVDLNLNQQTSELQVEIQNVTVR
jgi:hypothetical protein